MCNEENKPQLTDLQSIYFLSGDKLTGHTDFIATEKYFKDKEDSLNINDLLYTKKLLKENLKQLDNRLYIESFKAPLNLLTF